jgi:hypothetical protein
MWDLVAGEALLRAVDMGGSQVSHEVRIGSLVSSSARHEPYDGEVWSWSPAELNRVAYVDEGDLWIAAADSRGPERLPKGFTLPAWSDDGRVLAIAEEGRRRRVESRSSTCERTGGRRNQRQDSSRSQERRLLAAGEGPGGNGLQ